MFKFNNFEVHVGYQHYYYYITWSIYNITTIHFNQHFQGSL